MTAQIEDSLVYEGQGYSLFSNPLESYFDDDHPRPEFRAGNTAILRGYVAGWEIENDTLFLVRLRGQVGGDDETYAVNAREVGVQDLFPWAGDRVKATWFTGELRLPQGKLIEYVHRWYESTYEEDLLLTFEKGKLIRREVRDNRHLIPEIQRKEEEEQRQFDRDLPYIKAIAEGRQLRWKERDTIDKIARVVGVPVFIIILPAMVPYLIYKHGWNPKKWNLF